jgi:hypothetical protein
MSGVLKDMVGFANASSISLLLLAFVDAVALLGGLVFTWRALKRLRRFAAVVRKKSFEVAVRSVRHVSTRQAMRCATDLSYYLSRLALLFTTNLVSVTGVIFAAICLANVVAEKSSSAWTALAGISLLMFTLLTVRSFYRTVRLARQVLQIRRKIRNVDLRKRWLAHAAQQSGATFDEVRLLRR